MKVTVIDRLSGKQKVMDKRYARILTKLGRATYMTRDVRAVEDEPLPVSEVVIEDAVVDTPKATRRSRKAKAEE